MRAKPTGINEHVVPFNTEDGITCNLIHVTSDVPVSRGPVMLVHGAGVRANIFRAPVDVTLVDYLLAEGFDVWLENWRASIDLPATEWTLGQAAVFDHPKAVETIIAHTGAESIKAVIHCQGSTSFMMGITAGLMPQVESVVSNAVSLHPLVPTAAYWKAILAPHPVALLTPYLNPQWAKSAPTLAAKLINGFVKLTHWEPDNDVTKFTSFTYGVGFPTLWNRENLNEQTRAWVEDEFAAVPLTFFKQMRSCLQKGHLVDIDHMPQLDMEFGVDPPRTDARFTFIAGKDNRCFLWPSQEKTYKFFNRYKPDFHNFHLIDDYGHLDIFMGQNASQDVFPIIAEALKGESACLASQEKAANA